MVRIVYFIQFDSLSDIFFYLNLKELIPPLKKQSLEIVAYLEPNIQVLTAKTVDIYHSSKSSVVPFVFKVQEMADPHIQVSQHEV